MASAHFELRFFPQWHDVETIRNSVSFSCRAILNDTEREEAISMVTAELLENAIKHGAGNGVHYQLRIESDSIVIEVSNEVASPEQIVTLNQYLQWIQQFADPRDAYLARMREIYASTDASEGGLGLVRAAYEGGCSLKVSHEESNSLSLLADFGIGSAPSTGS